MSASIKLFQRAYRLVVDTLELKTTPGITPLNIKFTVNKNLKPEPNKANIQIYNLNPDHRSALEQMKSVPVSLEAGYEAGQSLLFLGNLRTATTERQGADLITTVASGDKEQALRNAQVSQSFAKGTADISTIFRLLARSLGVTEGNLNKAVSKISQSPLKSVCSRAFVLSGSSSREMTALCRSVGYSWSVQNGALQLVPIAKALAGDALVIDSAHGLIGSPSVDNKGVLTCKVLMMPDVFPGRLMLIKGLYIKGGAYRIEETEHTGEMMGNDWYVNVKGQAY